MGTAPSDGGQCTGLACNTALPLLVDDGTKFRMHFAAEATEEAFSSCQFP